MSATTYSNRRNAGRQARGEAEEKQYDERVVHINRVARVVRGGRRFRFQALVVVGDHKGKVGVGVAKGADVTAAVNKATDVAKKSVVKLNLYQNTLTHDVQARVGGSNIIILPAAPGTGIIAGGVVRTVLEVAGIENALSKSLGASNRINTAYAAMAALKQMVPAKLWLTNQPAKTKPLPEKPKTKRSAKA